MNEVEVNVVESKLLQAFIKTLLDSRVECAPKLGRHENVLPLDASLKGLLETFADFGLVAVDICAVNVLVSRFEGMSHSIPDFARFALPCPETARALILLSRHILTARHSP